MDILSKLSMFLGENISKYEPRKVKHGRKKSASSRLTGEKKRKYLLSLRDRKKKYKRSSSAKRTVRRKAKVYKRTAGAKISKRLYRGKRKK